MASHKLSLGARPEYAPLTLIRMFGKHKVGVLAIWLLLSGVAVVIVMQLPTIYRSEALILVDSQKIPERYVNSSVAADLQDRLATINQQILSATNLNKLIGDYGLYKEEKKNHVQEDIIEMMHRDIQIQVEKGWSANRPGAFRVAYLGKSPSTVAEVANRLANLYIEENLKAREKQAGETEGFIENRLKEAKGKLDKLEADVSKYRLQHNGELPEQENTLNGTLSRLQIQLQGIQEAINRAQQNRLMLESTLSIAEATQSALGRVIADQNASALSSSNAGQTFDAPRRKASELLEDQLKTMRLRYSDEFPDIKRIKAQIENLKAAETDDAKTAAAAHPATTTETPGGSVRPAATLEAMRELSQARERTAQLRAQLKLTGRELETHAAEQKGVLAAIGAYERRLSQLPVRQQEMAGLTRDYDISRANYKSLLEKKESATMAKEMEMRQVGESFSVLDMARIPEKPYSPNRPLFAGIGSLVALMFGLAFGAIREMRAGCLLGEWELPAAISTIGRVPRIDFLASTARPRRLRAALVSSVAISLALAVAVGLYFAWSRM